MQTFVNKSSKNAYLWSKSAPEFCALCSVKSYRYINSTPLKNGTTYEKLIYTTSEVHITSIDNEWEDYTRKYGEQSLDSQHNRSKKQKLKWHVQKLNEIFFEKVIWTTVSTIQCILETGWTSWSLFMYCSEWCRF